MGRGSNHGEGFAERLEQAIRAMDYVQPRRAGVSFNELQIQNWQKNNPVQGLHIDRGRINSAGNKVNRKRGGGRIDMQWEGRGSCEVVGPTRRAILQEDISDESKWFRKIRDACKRQRDAAIQHPDLQHYVAVLFEGLGHCTEVGTEFRLFCLNQIETELKLKLTPSCTEFVLRENVVIIIVRVQKA